jgi:hypothetical protein
MLSPQDDSSVSSGESITDVMSEVRAQMDQIQQVSKDITQTVEQLFARAKEETTDWLQEALVPKPALSKWLKERGLPNRISMDEFLDICYDSAKSLDLDSRVITFHKADAAALWNGQRRMTVFDLVAALPELFA